MGTDVSFLN